jgi:hypothetical protein
MGFAFEIGAAKAPDAPRARTRGLTDAFGRSLPRVKILGFRWGSPDKKRVATPEHPTL